MTWTPFGSTPESHPALVDGVPAWLDGPLRDWFIGEFETGDWRGTDRRVDRMRRFDLDARSDPYMDKLKHWGASQLWSGFGAGEKLRMLDWLIRDNVRHGEDGNDELEEILRDGGSKWKVGVRAAQAGLEERVAAGVVAAAEWAIAQSGSAGTILSEAWHALFGLSPDYEEAYEKAIKAVEEAGVHLVTPNNLKATLGTMIRDMKAQKDWKLDLPTSDADVPIKMAEALWVGQESRHGGNGYRKPTQAEAEAAVLLAVPLVQWFSSGMLARRP